MSMPLSKLIDNLSEGIHNNTCVDCKSYLDYIKTKNEKLILKCFNCKQYYKKKFNKELILITKELKLILIIDMVITYLKDLN